MLLRRAAVVARHNTLWWKEAYRRSYSIVAVSANAGHRPCAVSTAKWPTAFSGTVKASASTSTSNTPSTPPRESFRRVQQQKQLNQQIMERISRGDVASFRELFDANVGRFSLVNAITVLFHCAKRRRRGGNVSVSGSGSGSGSVGADEFLDGVRLRHLSAVLLKLSKQPGGGAGASQLSGQGVGNLLYSFAGLDRAVADDKTAVLELLRVVDLTCLRGYGGPALRPQEVANALYGLQHLSNAPIAAGDAGVAIDAGGVAATATMSTAAGRVEAAVVRSVLASLTPLIRGCMESVTVDISRGQQGQSQSQGQGQHIGNMLYGLKNMACSGDVKASDTAELREVLRAISDLLGPQGALGTSSASQAPSAQAISNALYGLRRMNSEIVEVRELLKALTPLVARSTEAFRPQNVSNSLYGMQGMSSEHAEVRDLVGVLSERIATCTEPLIAQHIGNALYGLQGMTSGVSEVRSLLATLAPLLSSCEEPVQPRHVDNALFGLRGMSSDHREVRSVLSLLSIKIQSCDEVWTAENLTRAVFGMQNMYSRAPEVRDILASLTLELSTFVEQHASHGGVTFTAQNVGNILYGLQNMSSGYSEVREFMLTLAGVLQRGLTSSGTMGGDHVTLEKARDASALFMDSLDVARLKVQTARKNTAEGEGGDTGRRFALVDMTAQNVGNALYGLQNMSVVDHAEVGPMLSFLSSWIDKRVDLGHGGEGMGPFWLDGQAVSNALYGLQRMSSSHPDVNRLLKSLERAMCIPPPALSAADRASFGMTEQEVGLALYGLHNMTAEDATVRALLTALLQRMEPFTRAPTPDAAATATALSLGSISCAFYGMRNMSVRFDEVSTVVTMLTQQLQQHLGTSQSAANLSPHLRALSATNMLYGLQTVVASPDTNIVGPLLNTLAVFLRTIPVSELTMVQAGLCMQGFLEVNENHFGDGQTAAEDILDHISRAMEGQVDLVCDVISPNRSNSSTSIAGFKIVGMYQSAALAHHRFGGVDSVASAAVTDRIRSNFTRLREVLEVFDETSGRHVSILPVGAAGSRAVLGGNASVDAAAKSASDTPGNRMSVLQTLLSNSDSSSTSSSGTRRSSRHSVERSWIQTVRRMFASYAEVKVESNAWLGGFEGDIVVTIPRQRGMLSTDGSGEGHGGLKGGGNVIVNIELDGPHHFYMRSKRRFTRLRDEYLQHLHHSAGHRQGQGQGQGVEDAGSGVNTIHVVRIPLGAASPAAEDPPAATEAACNPPEAAANDVCGDISPLPEEQTNARSSAKHGSEDTAVSGRKGGRARKSPVTRRTRRSANSGSVDVESVTTATTTGAAASTAEGARLLYNNNSQHNSEENRRSMVWKHVSPLIEKYCS